MSTERSEAFKQGEDAYEAGQGDDKNPHKFGSDAFMDWNDGYNSRATGEGEWE